jgi:YD repeat-containing protein
VLLSSYTYDGAGNQLTQMESVGVAAKTVSLTYRANGSVATETDRNGVTTTYAYDIHGRTLSKAAGGRTISYTYDANAKMYPTF